MSALPLILALVACDSGGLHSEESARAAIAEQLAERYDEKFEVSDVEHRARGLEGMDADRHSFTAHPVDDAALSFEGTIDLDLEPVALIDDYPCKRDAEASQAALEAAAAIPGTHRMTVESLCVPERLPDIDLQARGAAFRWKLRLAAFGDGPLLEATAPLHKAIDTAAAEAGIGVLTVGIDLYEEGADTVGHYSDAALSPAARMWMLGATVQSEVGAEPTAIVENTISPGIAQELEALAQKGLPSGGKVRAQVFATNTAEPLVEKDPDAGLANVPVVKRRDLQGYVVASVIGTPESHGDAMRSWLIDLFRAVPDEGRFAPTVYVGFFDPSTDPSRPLSTQPDKQTNVWLYSGATGLRIRKQGLEGIRPVEAVRYVIPGD